MSTVPIFNPCARTAIGRTSREASVKKSVFFIRGVNKSSETGQTASPKCSGLKLVADTEIEVPVLGIAGIVDGEAIIQAQRSDWQIKPNPNAKVGRKAVEGATRSG